MSYDRNPKFGKDAAFCESARRVADLLWETSRGDLSSIPKSYLEALRHDFSDGKISMLEVIDRVDLGPEATYEEYCEVVDALLSVNPSQWPEPESVLEVPVGHLQYEIEPDIDFSEFDFADEVISEEEIVETPEGSLEESATASVTPNRENTDALSEKMETFLKKVIASVYLDGVTEVTDTEGNPPNSSNNYLLSEDGKQFKGIFYDTPPNEQAKQFPFVISEKSDGTWQIQY
jgi:hypothetical protein